MKRAMAEAKEDVLFNVISKIIAIICCLMVLYPMYFIIIASISDPKHVLGGDVIYIFKGINLYGYKRILAYAPLWIGYRNSLFYSITGALLSSTMTLFAAYSLSRENFSGRKFFTIFFLIPMFFNGGLIPQYIVINALNLRNTYFVLLFVNSIHIMNIFIARAYFRSTNIEEMFEASQIDGCSHFGYYFRILLPISKPIIIVMLLFYGIWQWNDYFRAMIYLDYRQYYPIQLVLKELLASSQVTGTLFELLTADPDLYNEMLMAAESMKYGIIIIATMPMIILYLILQRYLVRGITMGSVKG